MNIGALDDDDDDEVFLVDVNRKFETVMLESGGVH